MLQSLLKLDHSYDFLMLFLLKMHTSEFVNCIMIIEKRQMNIFYLYCPHKTCFCLKIIIADLFQDNLVYYCYKRFK